MPIYKQFSYLCKKKVDDKSKLKRIDYNAWPATALECKGHELAVEGTKPKQSFLFYDSMRNYWKLASKPGGDAFLFAASAVAFPERIYTWSWKAFDDDTGEMSKLQNVSITCCTTCNKLHVSKAAEKKEKALAKKRAKKPLSIKEDSACKGWHKTAGCDPRGLAQEDDNKPCTANITAKLSGYCLCASGRRHEVACGHDTFTCQDACKIQFPVAYAASGERVWTNQFARNLLRPHGSWLSPTKTKDQWVALDLGEVSEVDHLDLKLWANTASPKHCRLEKATAPDGPWFQIGEPFKVPMKVSYTRSVSVKTRYLRFVIIDSYGSPLGTGLDRIMVVCPDSSNPRLAHPAQTDDAIFKKEAAEAAKRAALYAKKHKHEQATTPMPTAAPTPHSCDDGVEGGSETDVDCGGKECDPCAPGKKCNVDTDCTSKTCSEAFTCSAPPPTPPPTFSAFVRLQHRIRQRCSKLDTCSKCILDYECGWCASSGRCQGDGCKVWAGRHVCPGGASAKEKNGGLLANDNLGGGTMGAKKELGELKQEEAVDAKLLKNQKKLLVLGGGAGLVLMLFLWGVGLQVMAKLRQGKRRPVMVSGGTQYGEIEFTEITYDEEDEDEEEEDDDDDENEFGGSKKALLSGGGSSYGATADGLAVDI
eukprot:g1151.t1